jgi:predicted ester cyclase
MHRRLILTAAALATPALALPARAQDAAANRQIAERFASTLTAHDMTAFATLFGDEYVNHQISAAAPPPPPNGKSAKLGTVDFFAARVGGIPDLKVAIEAIVADPEKVAASFAYTGTHGGTYFGIKPTGRAIRFTSCDIFAIRGGLIVEHWGMGDIAGILAQLRA